MAENSVYRLSVVGEAQFGQLLVCTFHYIANAGTIFDTQSEDLAQAWDDDMQSVFAATRTVGTAVNRLSFRGGTNPREGFDLELAAPVSGGIAGDALPPQTSAVITWTSGVVGRRYRGRSFLWPA